MPLRVPLRVRLGRNAIIWALAPIEVRRRNLSVKEGASDEIRESGLIDCLETGMCSFALSLLRSFALRVKRICVSFGGNGSIQNFLVSLQNKSHFHLHMRR